MPHYETHIFIEDGCVAELVLVGILKLEVVFLHEALLKLLELFLYAGQIINKIGKTGLCAQVSSSYLLMCTDLFSMCCSAEKVPPFPVSSLFDICHN